MGGRGPSGWPIFGCLPRHVSRGVEQLTLWDASVAGGGSPCCATMLAPLLHLPVCWTAAGPPGRGTPAYTLPAPFAAASVTSSCLGAPSPEILLWVPRHLPHPVLQLSLWQEGPVSTCSWCWFNLSSCSRLLPPFPSPGQLTCSTGPFQMGCASSPWCLPHCFGFLSLSSAHLAFLVGYPHSLLS